MIALCSAQTSGGPAGILPNLAGFFRLKSSQADVAELCAHSQAKGLFWELSPGLLAPEARIMPLDQTASVRMCNLSAPQRLNLLHAGILLFTEVVLEGYPAKEIYLARIYEDSSPPLRMPMPYPAGPRSLFPIFSWRSVQAFTAPGWGAEVGTYDPTRPYDPGRTRAYNPRLRRPMPYPLGHRTSDLYLCYDLLGLGSLWYSLRGPRAPIRVALICIRVVLHTRRVGMFCLTMYSLTPHS